MGCLIVILALFYLGLFLSYPLVMFYVTGGLVAVFTFYSWYDSIL